MSILLPYKKLLILLDFEGAETFVDYAPDHLMYETNTTNKLMNSQKLFGLYDLHRHSAC
jgi:hypothetical protein